MENILIVFEADETGINVGIDALEKLGKVDKDTAVQFARTNEVLNQRNKALGDTSMVGKFVDGMKKVQAASVGAFGTEAIKQYQKAGVDGITAVTDQLKKLQQQKDGLNNSKLKSDDVKLYNILLTDTVKQITELQQELTSSQGETPLQPLESQAETAITEINLLTETLSQLNQKINEKRQALTVELDVDKIAQYKTEIAALESEIDKINNIGKTGFNKFGNAISETIGTTVNFRTQLRQMQQELSLLEETGGTFSQKYQMSFDQLALAAGKVQDQLGDTSERVRALGNCFYFYNEEKRKNNLTGCLLS